MKAAVVNIRLSFMFIFTGILCGTVFNLADSDAAVLLLLVVGVSFGYVCGLNLQDGRRHIVVCAIAWFIGYGLMVGKGYLCLAFLTIGFVFFSMGFLLGTIRRLPKDGYNILSD